ncbi:hypothetical protein N431DRAFT_465632 [Stipitochalara longipes BDJ]|nr:hypothetical protein N431DRAFT_465632 [Stipitochalara longipes BDJ]
MRLSLQSDKTSSILQYGKPAKDNAKESENALQLHLQNTLQETFPSATANHVRYDVDTDKKCYVSSVSPHPKVIGATRTSMTDRSAAVGPYSQAIKTPHAIYCSGQIPADSQGNIIEGTMGQRTEACINALSAVLTEAGSSLDKIVKAQIFLTDMKDFAEMNAEYEKLIRHKPARSCVAVKQLPKGVDIEIECIALP